MTTARDVIRSALEEIGVCAPGEAITDADAERSLDVLNDMLAIWSNENLAMFAYLKQTFNTVNAQSAYTIGPSGGDITGARPLKIVQAWQMDSTGNDTPMPLKIIDARDWNLLPETDPQRFATKLYYDPQVPLGIIRLWPTPLVPCATNVMSYLHLDGFPNLSTEIVLPLGYVAALKKNLAISVAPFFGQTPQPITIELARDYKGRLKVTNAKLQPAKFDGALLSNRKHGYNIRTDE